MKNKKSIVFLLILIVLTLLFDCGLVFYNKKSKNSDNKEKKYQLVGTTYLCNKKQKNKKMKNGNDFLLDISYEFLVKDYLVIHGRYLETLSFGSLEDYQWYIENEDFETLFQKNFDAENHSITYGQTMILTDNSSSKDETTFNEDYLNYLKNQGFVCNKK